MTSFVTTNNAMANTVRYDGKILNLVVINLLISMLHVV